MSIDELHDNGRDSECDRDRESKPLTEPVLLILLSLADQPRHGYSLMNDIRSLSKGRAEWIARLTADRSVRGRCLPDNQSAFRAEAPHELTDDVRDEVLKVQQRIATLISHTVNAIAHHDFPGARRYCHEEIQAREELRRLIVRTS